MNIEMIGAVCDRLLEAVVNGLAQGIPLVLIAALWLRRARTANAATRHFAGMATLIVVAALPLAHVCGAIAKSSWFDLGTEAPLGTVQDAAAQERVIDENVPVLVEDAEETVSVAEEKISRSWSVALPGYTSQLLLGIWAAIGALRLGRLGLQLLCLRALKHGPAAPEEVRAIFDRLCGELDLRRTPQLRVCASIGTPLAAGFRRPAVLLPADLARNITELRLEQILRHELAHLARYDDWANLLQQFVRTTLFFHPGVIWLSEQITIQREIACDDHVLHRIGGRKAYALSLAEFASRTQARQVTAAPAGWNSQNQLKRRIDMILDNKRNSSPRLSRGKAGLVTLAAAGFAAWAFATAPQLALAEDTPEPPEPPVALPAPAATLSAPAVEAVPAAGAPPVVTLRGLPPGPVIADIDTNVRVRTPKVKVRGASDDEIEGRLARLEKLVEKLARKNDKSKGSSAEASPKPDRLDPNFHFEFNRDELAEMSAKASRDAERAMREAKKRIAEVHADNYFAFKDGNSAWVGKLHGELAKNEWDARRHALEEQRRFLEKQMRDLDLQMRTLDREKEKFEEERARSEKRRENKEDDSKEEKSKDKP